MAHSAETVMSTLEEIFIDPPTIRNSVRTVGGNVFRIDSDLWEASPILREHSASGGDSFKTLTVPENSVSDLLKMHRRGILPQDFSRLVNLLSATCQLGLEELTSRCFNGIVSTVEEFTTIDFPSPCAPEAVLDFFRILVNSPLRTTAVYRDQLARVARHCSNNRGVMMKAVDIVKRRVGECDQLQLECLPVPFNELRVPVAIIKREGNFETVVCLERQWKNLEVFGRHCDLRSFEVCDSFYLKYGAYLLFKSHGRVLRKNLRDDSDPEKLLDHCSTFLTMGQFVFAVVNSENSYSVLQWKDDSKFVQIHSTPSAIVFLDFDYDLKLLVIQDVSGGFTIYKMGTAIPVWIPSPDALAPTADFLYDLRNSRLAAIVRKSSQAYDSSGVNPRDDIVIGEKHFSFKNEQLVLKGGAYTTGDSILSGEETPILSELCMLTA